MTFYLVFQDIRAILEKRFKEKSKLVNYTTDFEAFMNNALSSAFPNITRTGCYFHYKQCIDRNLCKYRFKIKNLQNLKNWFYQN